MNRPCSVGVIGIGFGRQVHVPAFGQDSRCVVRAICASNLERARKAASELGIEKAIGDWRELVADPSAGDRDCGGQGRKASVL